MAKRPLGLGKKNKEKKRQKVSRESTSGASSGTETATPTPTPTPTLAQTPANQISVELDEDADPDDELSQLRGLWMNYFRSDRDDELVLNGIVHECDRLLRNSAEDKSVELSAEFHAIYALALSELTIFKVGEEGDEEEEQDAKKKSKIVDEFFDSALERCELGASQSKESSLLKLVHSKVLLQRIPLQYISNLTVSSTNGKKLKLHDMLESAKANFQICGDYLELTFEVLQMFDDLLDIVENFGHEDEIDEGLDSDDEDDLKEIELSPKHPLYQIQNQLEENYDWLRSQLESLFAQLTGPSNPEEEDEEEEGAATKDPRVTLYRPVARKLGQLYLKASEEPSQVFTTLTYEDDVPEEINGLTAKKAQEAALKLTSEAIKYFEKANDRNDPQTWVDVAEATIDLGNLYDYQSAQQEESYRKAEELLNKANRATHGKYKDILDNLLTNKNEA